jgi:hypothetical protein
MLFGETVAVYYENCMKHIDTVRTSQETHYVFATEPNWLMLFRETVPVYHRERERENREGWGRFVVRDTDMAGVKETIIWVLKVPRKCPLALLVGVRLVFRLNSKF